MHRWSRASWTTRPSRSWARGLRSLAPFSARKRRAGQRPSGKPVRASIERRGKWVFGTGLRASEPARVFERMRAELTAAGSSMSRVARLDQYYPDVGCVDAYHAARKQAFGVGQIAPSTSVV